MPSSELGVDRKAGSHPSPRLSPIYVEIYPPAERMEAQIDSLTNSRMSEGKSSPAGGIIAISLLK